jgi:hypothetical protein
MEKVGGRNSDLWFTESELPNAWVNMPRKARIEAFGALNHIILGVLIEERFLSMIPTGMIS